jgi:branched-chain amino acid transport system ATP-binding protein
VLLIEQFAHVALGLAKSAYVLEGGRIRYSGTAQELRDRPELLHSAYMRSELASTDSVPPATTQP